MLRMDTGQALFDPRTQALIRAKPDRALRQARHKDIHDARRRTDIKPQVLRYITDDRMARMLAFGIDIVKFSLMRHLAKNRLQKRTLACTVRPDYRGQLAAMNMDIDVFKNRQMANFYGKILDSGAA